MTGLKALLIDDDVPFCRTFKALAGNLFDLTVVHNSHDALRHIKENDPEVVLLDYKLNERKNGLDVLKDIRADFPDLPVIMVTEKEDIDLAVTAMRLGATDFTTKAPNLQTLCLRLEKHLQDLKWRFLCRDKDDQLYGPLIYQSQAMTRLMEKAKQIAKSDLPLLIQGESGTGKTLLARAIHQHSHRQHRPFVPVNCGNLAPNFFESEIFGHEKGAYTGADKSKIGKLELAHWGTLFLDEICAMPLESQSKILTVIEENKFSHLGSERTISVDVRFIAATNAPIDEYLKNGRFREDLFYRLNALSLFLPPLRQRREDILPLARHFLIRIKNDADAKISLAAAHQLEKYRWPGNVRELKNVIESSVIQSQPMHELKDVCWSNKPAALAHSIDLSELLVLPYEAARKKLTGDFQALYFRALLDQYEGNVSAAAEAAGVNRATIHRFLKRS